MNAKDPFPFDPFEDSLLGEKIMLVWKSSGHNPKDLLEALSSQTGQSKFYFTPNATKQTLMVSYPSQIRSYIQDKDYQKIGEIMQGLANGSINENKLASLDIALELVEWLLTGFDIDEEIVKYLNHWFNKPQLIDMKFLENVRAEYVKELRG